MYRHIFIGLISLIAVAVSAQNSTTTPKPTIVEESIVVTGTYEPVPLQESDRAVTVLEPERKELFRTWTELLQLDPAIDLRQRGTNTVQGDLSIRGASFGQTLVLVNGIRVNDVQTGHHNLNIPLPLEAMERVEVLRGSGSTLYGADAVGGAVNFISSTPSRTEMRLGASVGNFGVNAQSATLSYAGKRLSQSVSAVRDFSSGFTANRDYRILSASSTTTLRTGLGATDVIVSAADRPFGAQGFYGRFNSWERTKTWLASVRQDLGQRTDIAVSYRRNTDDFILRRDNPSFYHNLHETDYWQASLRRNDELRTGITLFTGVEGHHEEIESSNLGRHSRNRGALYASLDARTLKRFSASVGAREEVHGSRGVFSPSFAGGVWLGSGLRLRGNASHAFRLPSYTDLYYRDPANRGNPDLRPESAWNYEGGLQWVRGRLSTDVAVFHRRERDVIDYVRAAPAEIWQATNFQRLNFSGVEFSTAVQVDDARRVSFAYAGLRGVQDAIGELQSKYSFNYPKHNAVLAYDGAIAGAVFARTRIGITKRLGRETYAVWDAALSRTFGHVRGRLSLANISDSEYEEILGVAMPGRSVVVGVDFIFPRPR